MTRKIAFFEGWSWFKFNNLGLALGTNLKFCTSVAKGFKLKVWKFWGPNPTFVEVTGENPPPILNRVKSIQTFRIIYDVSSYNKVFFPRHIDLFFYLIRISRPKVLCEKKCSYKFHKIQRKTPVSETLFK